MKWGAMYFSASAIIAEKLELYLACTKFAAFDIETTGYRPKDGAEIFAYCITWPNGYTEVHRMDTRDPVHNKRGWDRLRAFYADERVAKICHNFKFEKQFLDAHGILYPANTVWHDTMLMSRILRNLAPSHALDYFPWELIGYTRDFDKRVNLQSKARGGRYDRVDEQLMHNYQIADGERTMLLFLAWYDMFKDNPQLFAEYIVELETTLTTIRLQNIGVLVDRKETEALIEWLKDELEQVQIQAYDRLGEYINLNSDQNVIRLLFKRLEYPIRGLTKTRQPSTNKDVLMSLREDFDDPIFDIILKTRSYTNGLSMLEGYLKKCNSRDIIHPTINSCQAKTARQSGENPNLQNVSKEESLRNPFPVPARRCFRAPKGYILYLGDYAQIELRLIIDAAKSEQMMDILRSGGNVHEIACHLFYPNYRDKAHDKIYYDAGKNGHFALGYGAGPSKLTSVLQLSPAKAMEAWERYAEAFPEIAYLNKTIGSQVRKTGYIITPFGRKLYVPVSKAYSGLNYLIQCTAAMVLKRAEVAVDRYLKEEWGDEMRLVVPIHDELIFQMPRKMLKHSDEILTHISRLMVDMPEIEVRLDVEWKKTTSTWNRAKGFEVCYR